MAKPSKVGPLAAAALLEAFVQRQWELTEDEADELFDAVIELLSKARDERFRFLKARD